MKFLNKLAVLVLALATVPVAAYSGTLDFTSLTQVDSNVCDSSTVTSCLHISDASFSGPTMSITVDYAHILGEVATVTFNFTSAHGSIEGDTLHGCNGLPTLGTSNDCPSTNFFLGQYWGGTPGVGDTAIVSNSSGPEFHHGGPLFLDTDVNGTSLTISYNLNFANTSAYNYSLPFDFVFTEQAVAGAPEPSSVVLMSSALLVGLGRMLRRKR